MKAEVDVEWKQFIILVPKVLVDLLRELDKRIETEYALILRGYIDIKEGVAVVEEAWLPEQEAYPAFVKVTEHVSSPSLVIAYEEQAKRLCLEKKEILLDPYPLLVGDIGVLHKHPRGVNMFSSVDYEHLTSNFPISILWVEGGEPLFPDVTVCLPVIPKICIPKDKVKIKMYDKPAWFKEVLLYSKIKIKIEGRVKWDEG